MLMGVPPPGGDGGGASSARGCMAGRRARNLMIPTGAARGMPSGQSSAATARRRATPRSGGPAYLDIAGLRGGFMVSSSAPRGEAGRTRSRSMTLTHEGKRDPPFLDVEGNAVQVEHR